MSLTQKLTHAPLQVTADTNDIETNCHAILFDNYGQQGVKIFVNDTGHEHTGEYIYLPPGAYITLGNNDNFILQDVFDVVFIGSGEKGMNVLKQVVDRITF